MRKLFFILFFLALAITSTAQDKKQPKASDAPAEAVIEAKAGESVLRLAAAAEIAALRAENLSLKIAQAQEELKKLIDEMNKARDESNAALARAAIKAGVPGDKVGEYAREYQKDGSIKLTRKQQPQK